MARLTKQEMRDRAWVALNKVAAAGGRCPVGDTHDVFRSGVTELVHEGKIRIDIYFHNWRVVTILDGDNRGKSTAPCPKADAKPYRTIERGGDKLTYTTRSGRLGRQSSSRPITLPSLDTTRKL